MKINREQVFNKFNGCCAYCGCEIAINNFQIDHIWPKYLAHWNKDLDNDRFENLNPSCRKCNNFKHSFTLDEFRLELSLQVSRLKKNSQFDRALRFNQLLITESPIIFYFEKYDERNI